MKKINAKKLRQFYSTENCEQMKDFVTHCVSEFLEYSNNSQNTATLSNAAKTMFLTDLGLLIDITS